MLFNSLAFLIFFALVFLVYFNLPQRWRWAFLLAGSCYFYAAFVPKYILILFAIIVIDYVAGRKIEGITEAGRKRRWLIISILSNVGLLFVFKYFNFFSDNLQDLGRFFGLDYPMPHLGWILPIGLSFHTFQSLSYIIEVYRGKQKAERHFGIYALYVMFFPQLVAGPIERPQNMLHQFHEEHVFEAQRVTSGLRRMLYGFFKKIVIADNASIIANHIFNQADKAEPLTLVIGAVMFAFQIYGDFSGYSDIAIGSARVLGFRLMENFNFPYFATSVADFWRRWHISLTTWFRDYVYFPLGGSRYGLAKKSRNSLMVFLLSGLWHGANWTFVIWGLFNGILVAVSGLWPETKEIVTIRRRIVQLFRVLGTFGLVCLGWIFFRANSLTAAWSYIQGIGVGFKNFFGLGDLDYVRYKVLALEQLGMDKFSFLRLLFLIAGFLMFEKLLERKMIQGWWPKFPVQLRWAAYYAVIAVVLVWGNFGEAPFIYFQF